MPPVTQTAREAAFNEMTLIHSLEHPLAAPASTHRLRFRSVLLCGMEAIVGLFLERVLRRAGINTIDRAATGEEAEAAVRVSRPDLVITEFTLEDTNGVELARRVRRYFTCTFVLYDSMDEVKGELDGACACIEKPVAENDLMALMSCADHVCWRA